MNLSGIMGKWFTNKLLVGLFVWVSLPLVSFSQNENNLIKEGNGLYEDKKYDESISKYDEALKQQGKFGDIASYNKGNALYRKGAYKEAVEAYERAAKSVPDQDPKKMGQIYHNIGDSYLQQKDYGNSYKAFKQSLRYNPNDEQTRYNLAYVKRLLEQQQQQQQQ
ncbi:MAG: tetratricopeptide repeat protein, partial [Paludibacteraceae bacterium]|nr:tetratricopeptide repeat protein [Paludibacteraceae bacterium]